MTAPTFQKLLRVMTHLLKHDREMTVTRFQVMLLIHKKGKKGSTVRDLTFATGLNQSTIARIVSHLGDKPLRGQRNPLNWIQTQPDPDDPRRAIVTLTDKGKRVLNEIEDLM